MALTMEDLAKAEVGKMISTTDGDVYRKVRDGWWADEKDVEIRERHFVGLGAEGKLHLISDMPLQVNQIAVDGEWSYLLLEQDGDNWHVACVSNQGRAPIVGRSSTAWLTPRRVDDVKIKGRDNVAAMARMVMEARGQVAGLEQQVDTLTTIGEALTAQVEQSENVKATLQAWLNPPEMPDQTEVSESSLKEEEKDVF